MNFDNFPWATALVAALTLIFAVVGGAVVIFGSEGALTFEQYGDTLWKFVAGAGILGVGRGLKAGLEKHGAKAIPGEDSELLAELPDAAEPRSRSRSSTRGGGHV